MRIVDNLFYLKCFLKDLQQYTITNKKRKFQDVIRKMIFFRYDIEHDILMSRNIT